MNEIWQTLETFPTYSVSSLGRVRSEKTGRILIPNPNTQGFYKVSLYSEKGRHNTRAVSTLVLNAFDPISNLHPLEQPFFNSVIHLNTDRSDCRLENLMRRPRWFAIKYHAQFELPSFKDMPELRIVGEDYVYRGYYEICTTFGLLHMDVLVAAFNNQKIFPTGQEFELVYKSKV